MSSKFVDVNLSYNRKLIIKVVEMHVNGLWSGSNDIVIDNRICV